MSITNDDFMNMPLPVSVPKEQQKIADSLSSLDELIMAENRKLGTLKVYKNGLMQQLVPREGETVPRLRLPGFRRDPQWISATLGDIANVQSGGTPARTNPAYWNGDIPWVTTSLIDSSTILKADEYITKAGLEESSAKIFPKGTLLMAMYGQGRTRGRVSVLGIDAATNQACAAIILKRRGISTDFVFQNLASRYEEIRKISNSGGQENLSAGLIEGISFSFPDNESEQEYIANTLSSIDGLITTQRQKIDALEIHKKGLMQQLFPVMAEALA
jgi:type I restriction enzyme S subunit